MIKNNLIFLFFSILLRISVSGQEEPNSQNLQDYTPSVLINEGQTEYKIFNNIYTQTKFFNESGNKKDAGGRSTYLTSILEYNYGVSSNFTLGGELWFKSVKIGNSNSNPFGVLSFTNSETARTAISGLGLKIKFNPIKKWKRLSVQSTFLANVISDPKSENLNQPFLDNNRHQWITKAFYDKQFGQKFQLFMQLATWVNIDKELAKEDMGVAIPLDVFASYFATNKLTFYLQNQIWPSLGSEGLSSYFYQSGIGVKYLVFKGVELEGLYTKFLFGENTGAGETFNIGIRILN
jgi:hypothetical protein